MPDKAFPHLPARGCTDLPESGAAAPDRPTCPFPLRDRRILVVEDEYMLAMDLEEALRAGGATVAGPAADLAAAFEAVKGAAPDGAILDVRLRGEDVFPLADRLRDLGVPFLLVTGIEECDLPPRFAAAPRCVKPLDMNSAVAALGALMAP